MTDAQALQKLFSWLSPAFPVGGFAWSGGLETAIAERQVTTGAELQNWILGNLRLGSLRTDAILLAHAYRAWDDPAALRELSDIAIALTPSAERLLEQSLVQQAFIKAANVWPSRKLPELSADTPYPIALGATAAAHGLPLPETLLAHLTNSVNSQISVAVRLVPIGQTEGLRCLAALEPDIAETAAIAANLPLDAIGSIAYASDIAQMRHEALEPRIFRS